MLRFAFIGFAFVICGCASTRPKPVLSHSVQISSECRNLVDKLGNIPISGSSFGGPYVGITSNSTTDAVIVEGHKIVPFLVRALRDPELNKVTYAVFCLRELKAYKESYPEIMKLKRDLSEKRRFAIPRDVTLEMQFQFFEADCHNAKCADDIQRAIPAGWSVSVSNTTVRIWSERDMTLIGRIARPVLPGGMEQLAREMGHTAKYEVTLSFAPRLGDAEIERLRAARRPFEEALDRGARSKMEYTRAQIGYKQHRVPMFYTDGYSIFVDRPDDRFVEVYPPDSAAQVGHLMAALGRLFHAY